MKNPWTRALRVDSPTLNHNRDFSRHRALSLRQARVEGKSENASVEFLDLEILVDPFVIRAFRSVFILGGRAWLRPDPIPQPQPDRLEIGSLRVRSGGRKRPP